MNYSTAILLYNPNARAIRCSYEPNKNGGAPSTYLFKTFDASIKVGDFVSVPTDSRWNMTINRVEEVDSDVDFDSTVELKWIIGKVDAEDAKKIMAEESVAIDIIKKAEKRKKREELKASVEAFQSEEFQALQIAHRGAPTIDAIEGEAKTN